MSRLVVETMMNKWEKDHPGEQLTYSRLADETGIPLPALNRMRNSVIRINLKRLDAVCQFFRCQPKDVLEISPD